MNARIPALFRSSRGFTLMEVSAGMAIMLMVSAALVIMLQQHLTFMQLAQRQSFLAEEAPKIGSVLGRMFQQADHYFIYENLAQARGGGAPVLAGGTAVRLFFKTAAQTTQERFITAEAVDGSTRLQFHTPREDGTLSSWLICQGLQGAVFRADEGLLSAVLTGPNGEEVAYCGGGR